MNLRHSIRAIAAACAMVAFSGAAVAQTIAGSPHDLSSGDAANSDNNEVCAYCHTPHGGSNDDGPLWNKPATGSTYTTYDSTTIDGVVLTNDPAPVSMACLTCHDGTQAIDAVINAPGSGSNATNLRGGVTIGNGFANLGADLSNDHPIAIQYGGFNPGSGQIDPDFVVPADNGAAGAAKRWWVDTGGNGVTTGNGVSVPGVTNTREKTDMILYTRLNGANNEPFVECGSCHDPHAGNDTGSEGGNSLTLADAQVGSDVNFMRINNDSSNVCLACHVK
jgi:hypothetical protein